MTDPRPHNPVAEQAVIGITQINPVAFAGLSAQLKPCDFYSELHQHLWRAMLAAGTADPIAVRQHLRGAPPGIRDQAMPYLIRVHNTPGGLDADYYAAVVRRCAVARAILDAADQVKAELVAHQDGTADDFDAAASHCQQRLSRAVEPLLRSHGSAVGLQTAAETYGAILAELEHPRGDDAPIGTLTTTLHKLDRLAEIPVGQMTVIAARPGVGKSSLAVRLLYEYGRRGLRPHLWCLEDSLRHLAVRGLAQQANVDTRRVRDIIRGGQTDTIGERQAVTREAVRLVGESWTWDDTPGRTVEQIRMQARERVRAGARVLIVDHALRLRLPPGRDMRERINHVIGELAEMAAELQVATIVFTQLKRSETKRPPLISDLKESGKWEEDARLVLLLHRDGDKAWISVAKANHGEVGSVRLVFDASRCLWREPTPSEEVAAKGGPRANGHQADDTGGVM